MESRSNTFLIILCYMGTLGVSFSETLVRQKRAWIIQSFDVQEEDPGPFPKLVGKINVGKTSSTGYELHGEGVEKDPKDLLYVDPLNGDVFIRRKLDFEEKRRLLLTFEAQDAQTDDVDTRLGVEIQVQDINDNVPEFDKPSYHVDLLESASQDTVLVTVQALDKDDSRTDNGTFDLRIVSVTPTPTDLQFYLQQNGYYGNLGFKGCLDHKKAERYTVLLEARDRGERVQLSSTATVIISVQDGNNHMPVFTMETFTGRVKEREQRVSVLRLQVSDQDTEGTDAWRAVYTLHGDPDHAFSISTDPQTNEGVLVLEKPLAFQDGPTRNLSVSVENVAPYRACEVRKRPATGPWEVYVEAGSGGGVSTCQVTVGVEDVNGPPVFAQAVKRVLVDENVPVGRTLETFTATDLDVSHANTFEYMKGHDPNDWVSVDPQTCEVKTAAVLDREGPNVINDVYNVTVLAVDHGRPRMTGTATLYVHLTDLNDHAPRLERSALSLCLSERGANLTARDPDAPPFSGPFLFTLLGDVGGRWSLEPRLGYTVRLVKGSTVHSGHHELQLRVSDLQGLSAVHLLTVGVCRCSAGRGCDGAGAVRPGGGAIAAAFAAMLLMLGILLLVFLMSCRTERVGVVFPDDITSHLIHCNVEGPGTDCMVTVIIQKSLSMTEVPAYSKHSLFQQSNLEGLYQQGSSVQRSATIYGGHMNGLMVNRSYATAVDLTADSYLNRSALLTTLNQRMSLLQAQGAELGDYEPRPYAEEGSPETGATLDAISIPESPFDTDALLHLGPRFNTLASICWPGPAPS